ncbi:hypothetical protein [Cecembia rubra]|uniref:Uncharacterized protein n=1 Tax=Cecembia rubra TaxID=1485585 RepID=A0A2P8E866_9BACT|nr:hypothetical protein [Cecembia rubra]PSL05655.1 hypothetical protein CLV48_103170 [Cecembia rubra]
MWIASKDGFVSIVQHRDLMDTLMVRARVKMDLLSLFTEERILETPDADYRFRVLVPKREMAAIFAEKIKEITYPNFKNEIAQIQSQRDKFSVYHKIWKLMWDYSKNKKL